MKYIRLAVSVSVILLLCVISAGCVTGPQNVPHTGDTYIIGYNDYDPWTYVDGGELTGLDVEAAKWVAENQGFDVEFKSIEWEDFIDELNDGTVDIVWSGLSITPEREKVISFTNSYFTDTLGAAARKDSRLSKDDIKSGKYTIGTQAGTTAQSTLPKILGDAVYQNMKDTGKIKDDYATIGDAMKALSAGGIDFVVYDTLGIKEYMKDDKTIEYLGIVDENGQKYAAGVKLGNTELLEKLNKGLSALKKSDDWQYMQYKYGFARSVAFGR